MCRVLFVFGAHVFEHIRVWKKFFNELKCDRLGEDFRIGDRNGDVEMAVIEAADAFLEAAMACWQSQIAQVQKHQAAEAFKGKLVELWTKKK